MRKERGYVTAEESLVFAGKTSGTPYLLLVSGDNRVNEKAMAKVLGEPLTRPDADFVRARRIRSKILIGEDRHHDFAGRRGILEVGRLQQTLPDKELRGDQQGVAGEGRSAAVGGAVLVGGAQGQHLPEALAGLLEPVEKGSGLNGGGRAEMDGFTPGVVVWVRVRSAGLKGVMGAWSDPAQIRVL